MSTEGDPSGILVYPKVERKKQPRGDSTPPPSVKGFSGKRGNKRAPMIAGLVGAAAIGAGIGYVAKPSHAGEIAAAKSAAEDAQKAAAAALDDAKNKLAESEKEKATSDQQLAQLQSKASDVDKKSAELDAAQKKLQGAIDKESGTVETQGDEIHLKLVDKVLFATGDDQITDKGKTVLDKVAVALKDLPDKQIWVQGHTDDQPIFLKKPDAVKPAKPDPKAPKTPPKPPRKEYITNWELSAARALQVVHYLQDSAKIDPSRLAALAFGQYRPLSRSNKALNRRIEIVLYPKREILVKDQQQPAPPKK